MPFMLLLSGCNSGATGSVKISYEPPFIPVTFSLSNDGISITAGGSITTPIGTFSASAVVSVPIHQGSTRITITQSVNGTKIQNVYDIAENGSMDVCLNGHFLESIGSNSISITALDGSSVINIIKAGSACDAAAGSASAQPEAEPTSSQTPSAAAALPASGVASTPSALASLSGVWTGSYTCSQGLTGLRLTITDEGGGMLSADFDFYPLPSNPDVPAGSFTMTGSYSPDGVVLNQDYWVSEPAGYEMVNLTAPPPSGSSMEGTVSPGCGSFSVTMTSGLPTLTSLSGVWTGSYTCSQGLTGLRLTVTDTSGALSAVFDFYPVPSNPDVPAGSFTMRGSYSAAGVVLNQNYWISEPDGYEMVNLTAPPPSGNTMEGTVSPGCGSFSVSR
jgi:hypothetical protein